MHSVTFETIRSESVVLFASRADSPEPPHLPKKGKQNSSHKKKLGNRVLMVGRMRELALYRAEFLRQAGFTVSIAADAEEAIHIMQRGGFDALVLSYTLPSSMVQNLTDAAREYCPDCPVIAITETKRLDRRIEPDAVALAEEGPTALLSALHRVLEKN